LMTQRRLMRNLTQKFCNCEFPPKSGSHVGLKKRPADNVSVCSAEYLETFLLWASGCGDIVKLQAFQFVSELLHRRLTRLAGESYERGGIMSRRTLSTAGVSTLNDSNTPKAQNTNRSSSMFTTNGPTSRPDVLNESYLCDTKNNEPCELTSLLLQKLHDVIRVVCRNEFNTQEDSRSFESTSQDKKFSVIKVKLRESIRSAIISSTEFRTFEIVACELQNVDIIGLDDDHKTLFFINLYNIISCKYSTLLIVLEFFFLR
jgi:hypothetical protein